MTTNKNNYRIIPIGTSSDYLGSTVVYAMNLKFDPSKENLEKIRELIGNMNYEAKLIEDSASPSNSKEKTFITETELNDIITFNTLVFATNFNINLLVRFLNTQKTETLSGEEIKNLSVKIIISLDENEESISIIVPSISLNDISSWKNFGEELYNFKEKNYNRSIDCYQKYTSRIDQLINDPDMMLINGECGISSSTESYGFWLNTETNISGFDNFCFCSFSNDFCLLKYNIKDRYFRITSLTKKGEFGDLTYIQGSLGFESNSFYTLSGTNIIFKNSNYFKVYHIDENSNSIYVYTHPLKDSNNSPFYLIHDPWELSSPLEFKTASEIFEELNVGLTEDQKLSSQNQNSRVESIEHLGGWIKIVQEGYPVKYVGKSGILLTNLDHDIKPINNTLFLHSFILGGTREHYYFDFIPMIYETEFVDYNAQNAQTTITNLETGETEKIDSIGTLRLEYKNLSKYYKVLIDGLRRKPLKTVTLTQEGKLDNILTFRGLIYYMNDDKLVLF